MSEPRRRYLRAVVYAHRALACLVLFSQARQVSEKWPLCYLARGRADFWALAGTNKRTGDIGRRPRGAKDGLAAHDDQLLVDSATRRFLTENVEGKVDPVDATRGDGGDTPEARWP